MDLKNEITKVSLLAIASRTATATGTGVDLKNVAADNLSVTLLSAPASAGTNPTLNVVLQHSDDDSSYSAVTGGAFAEVTTVAATEELAVDARALKRYVRAVGTLGGTSTPTFTYAVRLAYRPKYV